MLLYVCYWIKTLLHVLRFGIRRSIDTLNAMSCNSNCSNLNKRYSGCVQISHCYSISTAESPSVFVKMCYLSVHTYTCDFEENWTFKPSGLNILTLIVLNIVSSFRRRCCISVHHILVHKRPASEQTEASRAT